MLENKESFRAELIKNSLPMANNDGCIFHDIETSILVGYAAYKLGKRSIWMPQLLVHNGFLGQGVGSDLINHVISRGQSLGKLFIDTIVHEEAGLGWLKMHQFNALHSESGYFGDRDGIYFRRMF